MNNRREMIKSNAGTTLIELAVSATIVVLIGLVVTKFWITTSEALTLDSNKSVVRRQSENIMERMTERLRRASTAAPNAIVVTNGNTIDFVDVSDGSAIQYSFIPPVPGGPPWGQINQSINGVVSPLGGHVQNISFTVQPTGQLVVINATFISGAGRTQATLNIQSSAATRN